MDPNNLNLRSEYKALCDVKSAKEKEWYSKMNGFYNFRLYSIFRLINTYLMVMMKMKIEVQMILEMNNKVKFIF